jgi:hypothetical protein
MKYKRIMILLVVLSLVFLYLDIKFKVKSKQFSRIRSNHLNFVTPEQFGANGFDQKDDTLTFQKALASNKPIVLKSGATYYISKELVSNHTTSFTTAGGGKKARIIETNPKVGAFLLKNELKVSSKVNETIFKGQTYLNVLSTKGMKAGDIIKLKSNKLWPEDNRGYLTKGELHRIKSISASTVYLDTPIDDSYVGEKVKAMIFAPIQLKIQNVIFQQEKPQDITMITVDPSVHSYFNGVEIFNSKYAGIIVKNGINTVLTNCYFSLGSTKDINTGYGYQDYGGIGTIVSDSVFTNLRRGVDFSGDIPSRFGLVKYSKAYGPGKLALADGNSGFGTHSTAEYITFIHNYVENFNTAFVSRGNYISFIDNQHKGDSIGFISIGYGTDVKIINNKFNDPYNKLPYFILKASTFNGLLHVSGNSKNFTSFYRIDKYMKDH